uniref:Uncharacterized protein n=1 Tax=Cyprinus carpio TaxID=7962 RepID=A0A8C1L9G3_CYPCA
MDSLLSIISSQRERYQVSAELPKQSKSRHGESTITSLRCGGRINDDTVMRYSSQYEERLDPFTSFSKKVRMSPWGRVILSNKRALLFHESCLCVCVCDQVLYKAAWSESIGRDCAAFCAKK